MAATVLQVYLLAGLTLSQCVVGYIYEYNMDNYCGRTLHIGFLTSAFKVKLPGSGYYDPDMDCRVHISGNDLFNSDRFYVQFLDFDVDCSERLQFYDGISESSPDAGSELCGTSKPLAFATTGDDLFIKFISDGSVQAKGFTLLINTFHTGFCKSYEFSCTNGRCIDNDLYCNDYDNCGDNSDYCYKEWWIWVIVGIVVFIVICVIITVICCCFCKKRTPGTVIKPGTQSVVHYQSGTQAAHINPWYGAQTQPTQPQPMGVQGTYPPGPTPYQPPVMPPPTYTNASGTAVYPPTQSVAPGWETNAPAPPPYSEKM